MLILILTVADILTVAGTDSSRQYTELQSTFNHNGCIIMLLEITKTMYYTSLLFYRKKPQ